MSEQSPIDPYFTFTGSSLNGSLLPYISFRLYSDVPSEGRLYWFIDGGNKSVTFPVTEGWNVYSFNNLQDWVSQTAIKSVRLDPGITASAKIMLDWCAIGSQPISANLSPSYSIQGNEASFITSPTGNPGTYTVTVSIDNVSASTTVHTLAGNQKPRVSFLLPANDTIVEKGSSILLKAEATDLDGKVNNLGYFANSLLIHQSDSLHFQFEWVPATSGSFDLVAVATDNAYESNRSELRIIQVVEQKPYRGKAFTVPGIIEAEDYDSGGEGISFQDQEQVNQGGVYRADPVDIAGMADGIGYYVGWTAEGEWLEYTIELTKGMKVAINFLLACADGGGELHFELNGKLLTNHFFIGATGGDQQFETFTINDIYLPEGVHRLRLVMDKGEMSIDHIQIGEHISTAVGNISRATGNILYPNPARDQFRITMGTTEKTKVQVISLQGQIVKTCEVSPGSGNVVSVCDLPGGTYIVYWTIDGKAFRRKLIKL